jgi:hypothetical protein
MGSCTITSDKTTLSSPGIIFVEARIKDDVDLGVEESEVFG